MSWQKRLDDELDEDLRINTTKRDWVQYALAWGMMAAMAAVATWALMAF